MNKISYLLLILLYITSCNKQTNINLETGDILFQDLDCGALCDAIENATLGKNNERFSHIAIVVIENDDVFVIEAYDGVSKIKLSDFLKRDLKPDEKSRVVVGRLKIPYTKLIPNAIKEAEKRIGLPYDDEFKLNNNKYYCSEFIYDIFLNNSKTSIFKVKPMTFVNQVTGKTDKAWVAYFENQGIPIPEGELGCNPIDYYESDKVIILGAL